MDQSEEKLAELPVPAPGLSWKLLLFIGIQIVFIGSGAGWATHRLHEMDRDQLLPVPLNEPLSVLPLYDHADIVSDEQLPRVLARLTPKFRGAKPKINSIDHALRCWGVEATFADKECLSGVELREMLLDDRHFSEAWGTETPAFLTVGPSGIRPRLQEGDASASHNDHTLAGLAEVGTPLDFPVITRTGEATVRSILRRSLRDFSLNQTEYEWSTLAYALYLPTQQSWLTKEGQRINFDRLADRIMRQALPQGVCLGNHRMHALVMLLRVHEQKPILSETGRLKITSYLKDITARYVRTQKESGYWDETWPGQGVIARSDGPYDPLTNRILATGHVMEWWSLAPEELHPPREVLVGAGQWLCETIDKMSDKEILAKFSFLSHAGRALALWRGRFPAQVKLPD